jgi:hypothetical protein
MAWVESESFGLCCPCLGDELAWRETFKGLQSSGEVVSVDEDQSRGLDPLLMLLPADAIALYVRAIPFARDDRLFERDADTAKEAAHHRRVGLDPAFGQQPIAQRLKRDAGFLGSKRLEKQAFWRLNRTTSGRRRRVRTPSAG